MSGESNKLTYKKRRLCGYNVWHREVLQSADASANLGELNKVSAARWQALTQEEREDYNTRAMEEASSCAAVTIDIKQILNQLAKLSNHIKDKIGGEFFFTLVKNDEHYCGGTDKELAYLQNRFPWVPYSFIGYLQNPSGDNYQTSTMDHLRREVEQIFNKRYGEITGNNRVPYSKLDQLGVTVEGLPNGIVFKYPSSYGRRQLQLIIETKDNIKFNVHGNTATIPTVQGITAITSTVQGSIAATSTAQGRITTTSTAQGRIATTSTAQGRIATTSTAQGRIATTSTAQGRIATTSTAQGRIATTSTGNAPEKLLLLAENGLSLGIGKVCFNQDIIHGQTIPTDHIKLLIDYIKPGTKPPLPTRFDDEDLCVGQFALWPRHLTKSST